MQAGPNQRPTGFCVLISERRGAPPKTPAQLIQSHNPDWAPGLQAPSELTGECASIERDQEWGPGGLRVGDQGWRGDPGVPAGLCLLQGAGNLIGAGPEEDPREVGQCSGGEVS